MKKSLNNRHYQGLWLRLGGTLLSLVLLVVLLSRQGWIEIVAAVRLIPIWCFVLAVGLMMISRIAVCGRWYALLKSAALGMSFKDCARLTFSGLFATNFLPTTIGGDVVRLIGAVQLKYDVSISAASLIVDRLIGMAGMLMALPFGISRLIGLKSISGVVSSHNSPAVFSLSFLSLDTFFTSCREKGYRFLRQLSSAFSGWLKHPRGLLYSLLCTWVHMTCWFGTITLLLHGMGESITFWQVAGLWSFVYFITQIPISINGYGLQEVSMALIYSNLGGISYQSSLTVALLLRTLVMLASLPGALYVPGILEARAKQENRDVDNFPELTPD